MTWSSWYKPRIPITLLIRYTFILVFTIFEKELEKEQYFVKIPSTFLSFEIYVYIPSYWDCDIHLIQGNLLFVS